MFFAVSLSIPEEGCCSLRLKSVQRGHTVVVASYTSRGIDLSATVTIAAYDPLMVNEETLIVLLHIYKNISSNTCLHENCSCGCPKFHMEETVPVYAGKAFQRYQALPLLGMKCVDQVSSCARPLNDYVTNNILM